MSQQSVRMNISPGERGFSSLWLVCKCWIWHLHLCVISSGYQFQISSLCWHHCCLILPCIYVYLEHLAALCCAIVSKCAVLMAAKSFPCDFPCFCYGFSESKSFFRVILCTSSAYTTITEPVKERVRGTDRDRDSCSGRNAMSCLWIKKELRYSSFQLLSLRVPVCIIPLEGSAQHPTSFTLIYCCIIWITEPSNALIYVLAVSFVSCVQLTAVHLNKQHIACVACQPSLRLLAQMYSLWLTN